VTAPAPPDSDCRLRADSRCATGQVFKPRPYLSAECSDSEQDNHANCGDDYAILDYVLGSLALANKRERSN
jgi:hypothetical protein